MSDPNPSTTDAPPAEASAGTTTPTTPETPAPSAAPTTTPSTPPATPAPVEDVSGLKAALEAVRKDLKDAQKENAKFKQQSMTEGEKAIEAARAEATAATAKSFGARLALAEFTTEAATTKRDTSGVLDLMDPGRFVGDDGEVDSKAIKAAVAKLPALADNAPPPAPTPPASRSGGDHRGGTGAGQPITEAQLAAMSPSEIATAFDEGRLKHFQ